MATASGGGGGQPPGQLVEEAVPCTKYFFKNAAGKAPIDVIDVFIKALSRAALKVWKPYMLPALSMAETDRATLWDTYAVVSSMTGLPTLSVKGFDYPGTSQSVENVKTWLKPPRQLD